jgi:hypothetical protein
MLMGKARIRCHCGRDEIIYTYSRGERGWYECDCGCAWSYQDVGGGEIMITKVKDCKGSSPKDLTILRHYPSQDIVEGRYSTDSFRGF